MWKTEAKSVLVVNRVLEDKEIIMSILNASILFTRANNVRAQLDYISGYENLPRDDLLLFNNLIRVLDKIYMSDNTREHRLDLQNFVLFNGDAIYRKYVSLTEAVMADENSREIDNHSYALSDKIEI